MNIVPYGIIRQIIPVLVADQKKPRTRAPVQHFETPEWCNKSPQNSKNKRTGPNKKKQKKKVIHC